MHELSAHYNVSNVPVREALLQLQGDGMVDMRMNKGAVVRAVDARFIEEFFDIREALQTLLIVRACRATGQVGPAGAGATLSPVPARVHALLAAVEDAAREVRVGELLAADEALQDELGRLGGNDQAHRLQASRGRLLEAFRRARLELWAAELEALPVQGRAMLEAIAHADAATGIEAVRRHVAASRTYMLRLLKQPEVAPRQAGQQTTR